MEVLLLVIILAVVFVVCLVPPVLAMTVAFLVIRRSYERARSRNLGASRYRLAVASIGAAVIASGVFTDLPYFELIPSLGGAAVVLSVLDQRRRDARILPVIPRARVI